LNRKMKTLKFEGMALKNKTLSVKDAHVVKVNGAVVDPFSSYIIGSVWYVCTWGCPPKRHLCLNHELSNEIDITLLCPKCNKGLRVKHGPIQVVADNMGP